MGDPHILCIDGHNFMHRARAGFTKGGYSIVFNFFRNLRKLVEDQNPTRVYFVLEGHPRARYEMMEDYKANRAIDPETMVDFHRQKRIIVGLLKEYFPIAVVRHPHHECDDTIYNLINRSSTAIPWTVVSNDTDFIQLLQAFNHVELWNPMKKEYVDAPPYNYIMWKALRGDDSDGIPGFKGAGERTAAKLVPAEDKPREFLPEDTGLISFMEWDHKESLQMQTWQAQEPKEECLRVAFDTMGMKSITKEKYWKRFGDTFRPLWGGDDR